jgi:prolyl oligopeptidase PreP (S9A serine peptidase family)
MVPHCQIRFYFGGQAAVANKRERAKRVALQFTYLSRKLMD